MPLLLRLQELQAKGDGGWKKVCCFFHRFPANQKITSAWEEKKSVLGILEYGYTLSTGLQ